METLVWNYMQWFYGQTDLVYVNSEFYRRRWIDRGIAPDKLRIFPRGLDTELFNPALREPAYWTKRGAKGPVLLYVGRISKEKDLGLLAEVMPALREKAGVFTLAIVGEGPYRAELEKLLPEAISPAFSAGVNSAWPMPRPIYLSSRAPRTPTAMSSWKPCRPACPWPSPTSAARASS